MVWIPECDEDEDFLELVEIVNMSYIKITSI
jgi:hypothetical protein